jgi:hypothetical protein
MTRHIPLRAPSDSRSPGHAAQLAMAVLILAAVAVIMSL